MTADVYTETDTDGDTSRRLELDEAVLLRYEGPQMKAPKKVQGMLRAIDSVPEGHHRPVGEPALWIDATDRDGWVVVWPSRDEVRSASSYDEQEPTTERRIGEVVEIEPLF